jgi:RNA-directed DNA polymerase
MKTYKNLFDKITDFDNLLLAQQKAQRGKRLAKNVATFALRLESNLLQLQRELQTQSYIPSGYTTFYIFDTKKRMISASAYRDRVVGLCEQVFQSVRAEGLYLVKSPRSSWWLLEQQR